MPPPIPSPAEMLRQAIPTPKVLSRQSGAYIVRRGDFVEKSGHRVRPREAAALRLVQQYTSVPVPTVHSHSFLEDHGTICMSYVNGYSLDKIWLDLGDCDELKEDICRRIWDLIYQFRPIAKPAQFATYFQCCADGTASTDVLIKALPNQSSDPLASDADLRERIYERYWEYNGRRYARELPDMLPKSDSVVFTHSDIAPRNIIIGGGENCPIVGIVDWEDAGWYPEYWEYANIMKPTVDSDWQKWMERTAPEKWDISGIVAARRVLF